MYIEHKYWNHYIGDSDDSLTLVEYMAGKQTEEISVGEIFADFGLDKLGGSFQAPNVPLVFTDSEGWETDIKYAIDLIAALAAILLECRVSGSVSLSELFDGAESSIPGIRLTAAPEEHRLINQTLSDFAANPLAYDLSEMCPEEDMREMAALCGELRKELYG